MKKRVLLLTVILLFLLPSIFSVPTVSAAESDGLGYEEVFALADGLRAEIEHIKIYSNQARCYYNLYIDGIDIWHRDAKPPEGSVIYDDEGVLYFPFSPFAKYNTPWNADSSPVYRYEKIAELEERICDFCDKETAGWILFDRLKVGSNGEKLPWLYTDENGNEWMSALPVYQQDSAMDDILLIEGLTVNGDKAEATLYTQSIALYYHKLRLEMVKTKSGWRITECEYLKFLTHALNEDDWFYEPYVTYSLPESPNTGDVILWEVCAYSAVALLCLSACVISKRKRLKTPL